MKYCKRCDTTKPLDEFHNNKTRQDGKASYCKPCWNGYMRDQAVKHKDRKAAQNARWLEANRERKRAQQAVWRESNKERIRVRNAAYRAANAEKIKAYNSAYSERTSEEQKAKYRANPEPARKRAREYAQRNADKARAKSREWRKANPERYRLHARLAQQRRRARRASLPVYVITPNDLRRLLRGDCAVTGCSRKDITVDHVIPIARGGSHGAGNLQSLCSFHNSMKGPKLWVEFRVYLARFEQTAA